MRYLFTTLLLSTTAALFAAEPTDSSNVTQLREIIVEGKNVIVNEKGITFMPTKREKTHAYDAYTLLRNMNLPILQVDGESVSTFNGESVTFYIDGVPATSNDCLALRPTDVAKIEYFENAPDARFGTSRQIINFVLKKTEWSGYIKLLPSMEFISRTFGNYAIVCKYRNKNYTYDLFAVSTFSDTHGLGSESKEIYSGLNLPGFSTEEIWRETAAVQRENMHNYAASLRIMHQAESGRTLYSTIGAKRSSSGTHLDENITYDPAVFPLSAATDSKRDNSLTLSWEGYAFLPMQGGNSGFNITPSFKWSRNNREGAYLPVMLNPIFNDAHENIYNPRIEIDYSQALKHNNMIQAELISNNLVYVTDYAGNISAESNPRQKLTSTENLFFLTYQHQLTRGLSIYISPGISNSNTKTNHETTITQWSPRFRSSVNYSIDNSNYLSGSFNVGNSTPNSNFTNQLMRQVNELMWIKGNDRLKNITILGANVNYFKAFNNNFNGQLGVQYNGYYHYFYDTYTPQQDIMVKSFSDDGRYHQLKAKMQLQVKLLNGKISLNPYVNFTSIHQNFSTTENLNYFNGGIMANVYLGNFNIFARYSTRNRYLQEAYSYTPCKYVIMAEWHNKNLSISAGGINFLQKHNKQQQWISTPFYYLSNDYISQDASCTIQIRAVYTFNIGAPIRHGNEIGESSAPSSSVM